MKSSLVLVLGPSGCGKSLLIGKLKELDERFEYISPYTTRSLRDNETDKVYVSWDELTELENNGDLLVVNKLYEIGYGTPRKPIQDALANERYPIIDWPISKLSIMDEAFPDNIFTVYLQPPDLETLYSRLENRENGLKRYEAGRKEMEELNRGEYDGIIDCKVTSTDGQINAIARKVHEEYQMYLKTKAWER